MAAKKKKKVQVAKVLITVSSTYNNTIISVTDYEGNVLAWSSPGVVGFSGSRKSTAFAASKAAEDAVAKAQKYGVHEAAVIVKGTGMGRQAAVKGIRTAGLKITSISDYTPIPHGGSTPRKKPRGS
ncbi:MAG: 30S ribosomal protein S11 [bacterium]